ncbi:MAG TPA: M1 family metallopeptidase [Thermoanaerobaculia bacterium]|nr:M1 family metallopeptidase [Thermoanaerobaculia bacterium]
MRGLGFPLTLLLLGCAPWVFACATGPRPAAPSTPTARPAGTPGAPPAPTAAAERDLHSFAHPDEVVVEHLKLDLTVDFTERRLIGRASLRLKNKTATDRLVLDTRDLEIRAVTLDGGAPGTKGEPAAPPPAPSSAGTTEAAAAPSSSGATFTLGDPVPFLGRPLEIRIAPATRWVSIDYATRPEAAALQWLTPAQAASSMPFLFTQSEAILARSWIPCQDTPAVRMTYEATVRTPPGFLAVMSAENPSRKAADGVYQFTMPQPIPSYLLALAVGDLAFRALDKRSGVYALPTVLERAAWELAPTPRMIDTAERLYGPYKWRRYDVLVLPPSYPYGGMENPRLTFATPTILAGDRSLVSLIAHELAHSWSGNLVTNATWNDFWLNEGFTVYFERRIMEALNGKDYADMLAALGRQDLDEAIQERGGPESPDTRLALDLAGRDPDEGTSLIAYEKGALFLTTIEAAVGRERFDRFLRAYFDTFAFQSMDTRRFLAYLHGHLLDATPGLAEKLRLDAWIYGPGLPGDAPFLRPAHPAAFAAVDQALAAFAGGAPAAQLATAGWTTHHWLRFLRNLPSRSAAAGAAAGNGQLADLAELDQAFHFTDSGNSEILCVWLQLAIRHDYSAAYPALERFLVSVGRRKFLKPLYTALSKTPAGMDMALRIYTQARPNYHPIAQSAVDKILDWRG